MPNIFPTVSVTTSDQSDVLILNVSIICAMVGEFEKGPDDEPILVDSKTFKNYFGSMDNARNKQSYISAIKLLEEAQGLQCVNVVKNAKFGGLKVTATDVIPFSEPVTAYDSYDFDTATDEDLGTGDGSTLGFTLQTNNLDIDESSFELTYTIGAVEYTGTDDGLGAITGTNISSGTINYATGVVIVNFTLSPDLDSDITATYDFNSGILFALIARSKGDWSNNIGIKISAVDSTNYEFNIQVYELQSDGVTEKLINTYTVSRNVTGKDGFGTPIYINTIFENNDYLFYAVNNINVAYTTLPTVDISAVTYADAGVDSETVTSVEQATAVDLFTPVNVSFDLFIGAGITAKTVIDQIVTLVDAKYKQAYIDTLDGTYSAIITWIQSTLNLDKMRIETYAPNMYVSYYGSEYLCPMSALAGAKKARRVKNGQPFMPPAGLGEDRGSLNVVRAVRYFTDAQVLELNKVGVNAIRYFTDFGNVIFSDWTMQRRTSATSYHSSVATLNKMITEFQKALLVINFRVINDTTFRQLESLIDGYLKQLIQYDGTLEPDYTIDFSRNTAVTRDAGKVLVDLIFVFQNLAREVQLTLIYTTNSLYPELSGT